MEFKEYIGELNDYMYGNMAYEFENLLYGVINRSSKIKLLSRLLSERKYISL